MNGHYLSNAITEPTWSKMINVELYSDSWSTYRSGIAKVFLEVLSADLPLKSFGGAFGIVTSDVFTYSALLT